MGAQNGSPKAQKSALHEIKESKYFDAIKWHIKKQVHSTPKKDKKDKKENSCKDIGMQHHWAVSGIWQEVQWVQEATSL